MSRFWELEPPGAATAALTPDGIRHSYQQLADLADQCSQQFPNDRSVGLILCRNTPATLITYLACLRHGHVALLLDAALPQDLIDKLIQTYRAEWLVDAAGSFKLTGQSAADNSAVNNNAVDQRAALMLSTSGSTGSPKQVVLSADNLNANAHSIAQYLDVGPDERPITTLPFHYSYGLSVINSHLLQGATLLITEDALVTKEFWAFFREAGATSLAGVPTFYDMLHRLRLETMDLPSLRTLTQAGGRLATEQVRHFTQLTKEKGWRFFVMYGQTEATARMAYLPPAMLEDYPDCIGVPVPGGEFWLADTSGQHIEETETEGELIYRGPNVMLGYACCREDLSLLSPSDVLHTGDLAMRNTAGLYRITGRLKRIIKLHGHRVSLDEMEQAFQANGHNVICGGDDQHLIIAHRPSEQAESLQTFAMQRLRVPATAIQCIALDAWPTTDSGKIAYHKLTESV